MERIHGCKEDLVSTHETHQVNIVIDTHTLYWFLTADKRLSRKAKTIIEESSRVVIPTIVLLELLYLFQKNKQAELFPVVLKSFKKDEKYIFASLDVTTLEEVIKVDSLLESHDRVIVATSQMLGFPIVTKDRIIRKMYKETIW